MWGIGPVQRNRGIEGAKQEISPKTNTTAAIQITIHMMMYNARATKLNTSARQSKVRQHEGNQQPDQRHDAAHHDDPDQQIAQPFE